MEYLNSNLKKVDKTIYELLKREEKRQKEKLILNAGTSFTPKSILEIQGSIFDNIDAEGYVPEYIKKQTIEEIENINNQIELYKKYKDNRFNKCCEYANIAEVLAQKRLAKVFENINAKKEDIFVNVQVPTGAIANYIVYNALLNENDKILSLGVNDGGHTTHGDTTHKISKEYKIINYHTSMEKENIDYDEIKSLLSKHKPNILVAGGSSFPLNIDWKRLKKLIKENSKNTILMADIAHTAGLIAGEVFNNPVGIADVTTLVTYKTFCGPRAAAIITTNEKLAKKIDETVFPKIMGSPLLLGIVSMAVASNIALTSEFKSMQKQIVKNSRLLCRELIKLNIPVVYKTSDTHIILIDCSEFGSGVKVANVLEDCNILVNSCKVPSLNGYHEGIRIGTTCITQKNMTKKNIKKIANIISDILNLMKNKEEINYDKIKEKVDKINF